MKTFAEYLPTMTAREREIVEAYESAYEAWSESAQEMNPPIIQLRDTPPAKEPVSFRAIVSANTDIGLVVYLPEEIFQPGDCVRVVKIEGTK